MEFRWNDWNLSHVGNHGVSCAEAEGVVTRAKQSQWGRSEGDKWIAWGRGFGGRWVQVIFLLDEEGTVYIIHARPLTGREKWRVRRRLR